MRSYHQVAAILALSLALGAARADEPRKNGAPVKNWEVSASLERDAFTLGEPIPLTIRAKYLGAGMGPVPALGGGARDAPLLEVKRNGGPPETVRTDDYERGALPRTPEYIRTGKTASDTLELTRYLAPVEAGSYEVVVVLASDASRSGPVRFVVRAASGPTALAAPTTSEGLGVRLVLRAELRGDGTHLVLSRPTRDARPALDLGAAPISTAQMALSVLPPGSFGVRPWVVVLDGRTLARTFVDGDPHAHAFPVVELPAGGRLVAALGGVPRPRPVPPTPSDDLAHVPDEDPWPDLHLVLLDDAKPALVGVTLAPIASASPVVHTRPLPAAPLRVAAIALTEEKRLVLVALAEGPKTAVFAHSWTAAGLGEPGLVLRTDGAVLALEAVALEGGSARVVALAPGREPGELVLHSALLGIDGAHELAPRVIAPKVTEGLAHWRVRLAGESDTWLLAERASDGARVAFPPEAVLPWLAPIPGPGWWDLELLGSHVEALAIDTKRGLLAEPLEPPPEPDGDK